MTEESEKTQKQHKQKHIINVPARFVKTFKEKNISRMSNYAKPLSRVFSNNLHDLLIEDEEDMKVEIKIKSKDENLRQ